MNLQEACEILADADRQRIIYELVENDGFSAISDLARQIASRSDISGETDRALERAKISLVHNHLPRLEDHGVIEYDTRSGDVVLTDAERIEPLLDTTAELESAAARRA